jgi:hypothetical protein
MKHRGVSLIEVTTKNSTNRTNLEWWLSGFEPTDLGVGGVSAQQQLSVL